MSSPVRVLQSLIVGAHFRPPAKTLLTHLPARTGLVLEAEPENPWDASAIRVMLDPGAVPETQHAALQDLLPASGHDLDEILTGPPIHLGYLPASKNKDLLKWPGFASNEVLLAEVEKADLPDVGVLSAGLTFGPGGEFQILIRLEDRDGADSGGS